MPVHHRPGGQVQARRCRYPPHHPHLQVLPRMSPGRGAGWVRAHTRTSALGRRQPAGPGSPSPLHWGQQPPRALWVLYQAIATASPEGRWLPAPGFTDEHTEAPNG